jgi:hypothetical protein
MTDEKFVFKDCRFLSQAEFETERLQLLRQQAQWDHGTTNGKRSCGPYRWRKWLFPTFYQGECSRCFAIKELGRLSLPQTEGRSEKA